MRLFEDRKTNMISLWTIHLHLRANQMAHMNGWFRSFGKWHGHRYSSHVWPRTFGHRKFCHANWLRKRLPAQLVDLQTPYTLWHSKMPDISQMLRFGQLGYAFQYRPDTVRGRKFQPCTINGHFLEMGTEISLYRILLPSTKNVHICRRHDFTVFKE